MEFMGPNKELVMPTYKLKSTALSFFFALLFLSLPINSAHAYVVGGASSTLVPSSYCWAWDSYCVADFRAALENPVYFGPGGVIEESITTVTLGTIDATSLSAIDMFIAPWIYDYDGPTFGSAVVDFFLSGGDLFLLNDSSSWDYFGEILGIPTTASSGSDSNGGAPLFDGPFGVANNVTQHYQVGQLDAADIAAQNGHVGGTNIEGQITSAFWAAGEYAVGAGALFIIADTDMIATTYGCGSPVCGATYAPLNDNGIYALNTFSFLQSNSGREISVPEPHSLALFSVGLLGMVGLRRRKRKT